MEKFLGALFGIIIGVILVVSIIIVFTIPLFYLWNWLMPDLFGLPIITFWEAIGIHFLSGILFGGYFRFINHPTSNND